MRFLDEKGGTLVEFAIIAPLLFLIVFGIIEFGIMGYDKAIITNASREAARMGIVFRPPSDRITGSEIQQKALEWEKYLVTFGSGTIEVPPPTACIESGDFLTVTVNYPFSFLVLAPLAKLFDINLSSTTVMRCE